MLSCASFLLFAILKATMKNHWDEKYRNTEPVKLGWYENSPQPSLDLIRQRHLAKDVIILDVGSGSSPLVDRLLEDGYTNIIATDISQEALAITQSRLGKKASRIQFITDDLLHPTQLTNLKDISVWHDRAVLHFFTEEIDRNVYVRLLKSVLKADGFVIISTFAPDGLTKCSGLNVCRYDAASLAKVLGDEFKLIQSLSYTYTTTWGQKRPFIYGVFQRLLG